MKKNKMKRIILVSIITVVSIIYASANKKNRNIGDAVQVTSLPVSGKVVILDAGHGTPDVGVSLLHKVKNKSNYSFIKN